MPLHSFTLPAAMLERGFWLYVWRVRVGNRQLLYVGRTGDNSSPFETAPYTRMGQHLGKQKNQNALRRHLEVKGIRPEQCDAFDLIAHGPIYPEIAKQDEAHPELMELHKPFRNRVGAMEKMLAEGLAAAGYEVMNTVNCKWTLDADGPERWAEAAQSFRREFPAFNP
ncbi:hypothetical protein [Falsirhodobacter algicola]|uniref:Uncharacterized protein n=1 Tax=Falsirhodobacter algicola TaxID=2692330 RepID=A0A8J8MU62_9RHOB|nr:hypothetical protein [Falsirhodobacter algicola]QUS36368.1 hypothetical protein GR316_08860 [Falsirhodobacter algicola]